MLARRGRQVAQCTGRHLDILRGDRGADVLRSEAVVIELGRIHPDVHRILRTEQVVVTDAQGAAHGILDGRGDEVGDFARVIDIDHVEPHLLGKEGQADEFDFAFMSHVKFC